MVTFNQQRHCAIELGLNGIVPGRRARREGDERAEFRPRETIDTSSVNG